MELRQLELFVALAEEQNFTRAAQRMNIVQSGLSGSLRELEAELGVRLFDRTTRRVVLTEAGSAFLPHARASILTVEAAKRAVTSTDAEVRGRLRIGILQCCSPYISIADVLDEFTGTFTHVRVGLKSLDNEQVTEAVRSGDVDGSFYALTERRISRDLQAIPYSEDHLIAMCSRENRLASSQTVTLERLSQEIFVDAAEEKALRHVIELSFRRAGLKRNAAYEVDNPMLGVDLVERDLGVTILQAKVAQKFGAGRQVHHLRITGGKHPLPAWRIGFLKRRQSKENAAADPVRRFLELLVVRAHKL